MKKKTSLPLLLLPLLLSLSCYVSQRELPRHGDVRDLGLIIPVQGISRLDRVAPFGAERQHGRRRHNGIDIFAPAGAPVLAPQAGLVVHIGNGHSAGNYIYLLDFRGEYLYEFLHLSGFVRGLSKGQRVRRGAVLGYVGNTGNAAQTPPHLHFSVARLSRANMPFGKKRYLNPMLFLH